LPSKRVRLSCETPSIDSLDLLLGPLAALGSCQPDGTFINSLDDLCRWLAEMAASGEAVMVDGLATRVQRPRGWTNQKVLYDAKRHAHTAQGLAVSTTHGDLLWCDGGWPGSCYEHELIELSGLGEVLDAAGVASLLDRGFWGAGQGARPLACAGREPPHQGPAQRRPTEIQPPAGGCARLVEQAIAHLGRRLVVVPLARAAVPGPGRLPSRWGAGLLGSLAAPGPHLNSVMDLQ